jgi:hypothetical protein
MREDRYVGSIDAAAISYYLRGGGVDMTAVRRARLGLNLRHFPYAPKQEIPKAEPLARGLSALDRARAHLARMESIGACTIAARANVARIEERIAPALSEQQRRTAALQVEARRIVEGWIVEAVSDDDIAGAHKMVDLLELFDRCPVLATHKVIADRANHPAVKAAVAKVRRSTSSTTSTPAPSARRPERSNLVTDSYRYFALTNDHYGEIGVAVYMAPQTKAEQAAGMRREYFVTQVHRVTKRVDTERRVHTLNRSYLVAGPDYVEEGVPMLRPPAGGSYQVIEPGDAWVGPYYSPDEA